MLGLWAKYLDGCFEACCLEEFGRRVLQPRSDGDAEVSAKSGEWISTLVDAGSSHSFSNRKKAMKLDNGQVSLEWLPDKNPKLIPFRLALLPFCPFVRLGSCRASAKKLRRADELTSLKPYLSSTILVSWQD